MLVSDILNLNPGTQISIFGVPRTVECVRIIQDSRESTDKHGSPITIDLSYLALEYGKGVVYSGPPIRMNLDVTGINRISLF